MEPTTEKTSISDHDAEKSPYPEKIEEGHTTDGAYTQGEEAGHDVSLQGGVHRSTSLRAPSSSQARLIDTDDRAQATPYLDGS